MIIVTYNGQELTEDNLFSVSTQVEKALVAESLAIDTIHIEFCLWGNENHPGFYTVDDEQFETADSEDFYVQGGALPEGWEAMDSTSQIILNVDGELSVFYPKQIRPIDVNIFALDGVSIIGVLEEQQFNGRLYEGALTGDTVGTAIAEIMGAYPYTIDADVASLQLDNYLPRMDKREALRQILFPFGISVMKDAAGNPYFKFNQPDQALVVDVDRISIDIESTEAAPITNVLLIEHSFYASAQAPVTVLFDNTNATVAAAGEVVRFDEPVQEDTLATTGSLTIDASTINSVTLSGVGVLTGKPYIHIQRVLQQSTGATGRANELAVQDAYLVGPLNSLNTLRRLTAYTGAAQTLNTSIYVDTYLRAGAMLMVRDVQRKEIVGYLRKSETTLSVDSLSRCEFVTNWRPGYVGNNYNAYIIIRAEDLSNGSWTVPQEMQGAHVLVTLFGGLRGGHSGGKGTTPEGHWSSEFSQWIRSDPIGGIGGDGGNGAMVYAAEMDLTDVSYAVVLGAGGLGGVSADGADVEGSLGGSTTFGTMSSANGAELGNYVNLIDGSVYITQGLKGENGGDGGAGGTTSIWLVDGPQTPEGYWNPLYAGSYTNGQDGEAVGDHAGGAGNTAGIVLASDPFSHTGKTVGVAAPGGGGGASISANGGNGGPWESYTPEGGYTTYITGKGGDGAAATTVPAQADFAVCGTGGYGGGAGGLPGDLANESMEMRTYIINYGQPGQGGLGSQGGPGSDGFVLIYFYQEV